MPDIMMCAAENCAKASSCYRHEDSGTTPCEWRQSYWLRDPRDPTGDDCRNFWPATEQVRAAHDGSMS